MSARFVGRAVELAELVSRLDEALGGRAGTALVAGEPGIGKTRLVAELGRLAGARAVPVLWGGCTDEAGVPAYWPWRRILRAWLALAGPEAAAARLTGDAADLALIAPELQALTDRPPAPAAGPEQRFALFDVAARFFAGIAADTGLVLVLDDVQWADPASLHLLVHLAREAPAARMLLAATYREAELAADPDRSLVLADLARLPGSVRLELGGLAPAEVAVALADGIGTAPSVETVAAVARRTGGNPFFVGELGKVLRAEPGASDLRVPAAVRDVVGRRLGRLSPGCRALLAPAAVIGREFDVALLAAVAGAEVDAVLDALQPAFEDGVLVRPPGRTGLQFGHDIVREAVLVVLGPTERARYHGRVAEMLEPAADDPAVLPEIAHHALAALPLGDRAAAVGRARQAAQLAMTQLAYEEAARLYGRAVDAGRGALPVPDRIELLLATADAQTRAHAVGTAIETCVEAAELARSSGDAAALGRAALVLEGVSALDWIEACRGWCEEALHELPEEDTPLRARLLAQLAHNRIVTGEAVEVDEASTAALAMAERLDDPQALVSALRARQLTRSGPDGTRERLVLGGRMLDVAARTGDQDVAMWGHLWTFDALLQAGRVAEADAELERVDSVVRRLRQPLARLHLLRSRAAVHFARGRYAEAAALNEETVEIARSGRHSGARMTAIAVACHLDMYTGSSTADHDVLEEVADYPVPYVVLPRLTLVLWHLAFGRRAEAARWFEGVPEPGSVRVPQFMALTVEAFRAHAAADLGDRAAAEGSYRYLLPYADLHVVGGAGATASHGSVQLFLGLAAAASDRRDAAVRHLRAAVVANDAAGLVPFAAVSRARLAEALRARGRVADQDEAVAATTAAAAVAERLGMAPLRDRIAKLSGELRDGGVLSPRESEIAELVGKGMTNRQIAAAAHISERTVETHVQHVLAKLGFQGRSQIAAWVARQSAR